MWTCPFLFVAVTSISGSNKHAEQCVFKVCLYFSGLYCPLQESKGSVAVRMALGETQIVQETRQFLLDNNVSLDSFSQVCLMYLNFHNQFNVSILQLPWLR